MANVYRSSNDPNDYSQRSGNQPNNGEQASGMQTSGMTFSRNPPYLLYPPEPSGRRPNNRIITQYVDPADRAANEARHATQGGQRSTPDRSDSTPHHDAPHGGGGPRTESSMSNHFRPTERPTQFWACCEPGCASIGPYIARMHDRCTLGCDRPRCPECHTSNTTPISQARNSHTSRK